MKKLILIVMAALGFVAGAQAAGSGRAECSGWPKPK